MTAAIVLWNTVYLERVTHALRYHRNIDDPMLQYLSLLGWEHQPHGRLRLAQQ